MVSEIELKLIGQKPSCADPNKNNIAVNAADMPTDEAARGIILSVQ